MSNLTIDQLIGISYVRYGKLLSLVQSTYKDSNATELNIYIDLESVMKSLYTDNLDTKCRNLALCSNIINMCVHYRQFFRSIGVHTRLYLIYTDNTKGREIIPEYNTKFMMSIINKPNLHEYIINSLSYIKVICDALPDIKFYDIGGHEFSGFVKFLMDKFNLNRDSNMVNIAISRDLLTYQLVNYNCNILRPVKYMGADNSFIVTQFNVWKYFSDVRKCGDLSKLPTEYFTYLLAMTRIPERSLYTIKSINVAFSMLMNVSSILPPGKKPDGAIEEVLKKLYPEISYIEFTAMDVRNCVINADYTSRIIANDIKYNNINIDNTYNPEDVKLIDSEFFGNDPLDLNRW